MVNIYAPTAADGLSDVERQLYDLIMDYRVANGLGTIPLSNLLTITAGRHAVDTLYNIWDAGVELPAGANLHSWSDAYYYGDHSQPQVMWDAPQRLGLAYDDAGFEISAAGYTDVAAALQGWMNSPGHDDVIMNRGIWANQTWNAIGVGVENDPSVATFGGRIYHVWFGRITDPTGGPVETVPTPPSGTPTPADQDLSGDGIDDILWLHGQTNAVGFYEMAVDGSFTWRSLGTAGAAYDAVNTGDFDASGFDDILWLNASTLQVGYYKMGQGGAFTWQSLGIAGTGYQIAGTGDFNEDGTDDILWYNTATRQVGYYRMDDAAFTWQGLGLAGASYAIVGTDDFNGDGTDDILWLNTQSRQLGYYQMDDTSFVWRDLGFAGTGYEVAGTGDFDGNGTDDILWFNTQTRQLGYYAMDTGGGFAWQGLGSAGTGYEVADIGNYDGDGTDDILWFNSQTRQVGYYDVDGAAFTWQSLGIAGPDFAIVAEEAM